MTQGSKIFGNHAFFFREGDAYTVPSGGNASRSAKPGATDTGWIDLGVLEDLGVSISGEAREVFAPTPGQIRLYDVIRTKRQIDLKLSCAELSQILMELLFGTLALGTGANVQFNPLEGVTKRGWLKVQQYDQTDTLANTFDVWVEINIDGEVKFDDNIAKPNLMCKVLHSTLNTGTIA